MKSSSLKKIVVLSSRSQTNYHLISRMLQEGLPVACVIFEDLSKYRKKILKYRYKKLSKLNFLGQLLFIAFEKIWGKLAGEDPKLKKIIPSIDFDTVMKGQPVEIMDVSGVNAKIVFKKLNEIKPDIVAVSGTGIIRKRVLSTSDLFLNMHCGITPKYRGAHGGFWAAYNNDLENCGVTIHQIDLGVDTGDIVSQKRVPLEKGDNLRSILYRQFVTGTEEFIKILKKYLAEEEVSKYRNNGMPSMQWYHPTILQYFRWKLRLGISGGSQNSE